MVFATVPLTVTRVYLRRRRGATVVELAITFPLAFLLIIGVVVGGLGVFRYQQVAHLSQLGARYASVRGGQYESETGQPAASQQNVRDYIISQSTALALDSTSMAVQVFLNVTNIDANGNPTVTTVAWDTSKKATYNLVSDSGEARQNTVSVTVRYQWLPEAWLSGPITLSSKATIPMQY